MTKPLIIKETSNGYSAYGIEDQMLSERKIICTGEINADSVNSMILQLMYLESTDPEKEITIYINSPGGEVISGLALYDVMNMLSCPIRTVCMGMAASMGSIIFTAGDRRAMLPHSKVMIHDPLIGNVGGNALHVHQLSENLLRTRTLSAEILAKHTGKTVEEILEKTASDCYFTAEEAVAFGLADEILQPDDQNRFSDRKKGDDNK